MTSAKECLSPEHFTFVMKYFHINSYFAHPENLLVCGLLCPISTNEIKEKCLKMLLKIRHTVRPQTDTIRQFFTLLPNETNPDADNIFDFINWDEPSLQNKLTFPPPINEIFR